MAQSFRHSAVYKPKSNKGFKQKSNRKLRRHARHALKKSAGDALVLPLLREISQIYCSPKDGGFRFFGQEHEYAKFLRK